MLNNSIINKIELANKGTIINEVKCPVCNSPMIVRVGHNKFLGCSMYNKTKCQGKYTLDYSVATPIHSELLKLAFEPYIEVHSLGGFTSHFDIDDTDYYDCIGFINCSSDM